MYVPGSKYSLPRRIFSPAVPQIPSSSLNTILNLKAFNMKSTSNLNSMETIFIVQKLHFQIGMSSISGILFIMVTNE